MDDSHRFQELVSWQRIRDLKRHVDEVAECQATVSDAEFRYQIRDAAHAAERHIVEGFDQYNPLVFANVLDFSRAATCETRSLFRRGLLRGYFSTEEYGRLDQLAVRALQAIVAFQRYLRSPASKRQVTRRYPRPYTAPRPNEAKMAQQGGVDSSID
jgi:four helix bundle protein